MIKKKVKETKIVDKNTINARLYLPLTELGIGLMDVRVEYAKEITLHHHEKYDGSGYPHKKSGDEIPLSAKIIALCDVYDALRETRAYKSSVSHDKSVEIIKGGSKTHFDPIVIKAFEKIHQKFDEIFKNFSLGYGLREENE